MKEKTVVITGATSGLGRATALQLAKKGAYVIIVVRNDTKANEVIKKIEKEGGKGQSIISDLSSMKDTKEAAENITKVVDRLDVLINNAGTWLPEYTETSEGFEYTLAVNYLSPFLLTHHLTGQMVRTASEKGEARIINISALLHRRHINWDDLNFKETTYDGWATYKQSKHMLTSFTYYLSRKLEDTGISANCIHPGLVKTALIQSDFRFPHSVIFPIASFLIGETPAQAADTPVWLASSNEVKSINGEYIHHRKIKNSWPPTRDEEAQMRLFNVTQRMLGEWL